MMKVVKLSEVLRKKGNRKRIVEAMRSGDVFVYPTDTIYGLGCDAENASSVERIVKAKGREESKRFSVIAPSKEWVWRHATLSDANRKFADDILPGPYTLIARAKAGAPKAVVSGDRSIGIRIPKHPFADIVSNAGIPFVSTSVNLSGEEPVSSIRDIPARIRKTADWAIDAGTISGLPSRVFDLREKDVKILRY